MNLSILDNWVTDVLTHFWKILSSKKNKKSIRLQRSRFVVMYRGWPYTFTIERGDRLNDKGID